MGAQKFLIRGGPLDCIKNNSSNDRAQVKPKITITVVKGQAHLCFACRHYSDWKDHIFPGEKLKSIELNNQRFYHHETNPTTREL